MTVEKEFTKEQNQLYRKIERLISLAPSNWAYRLSKKMGCAEVTVRAYANGSRGRRTEKPTLVLKYLKEIIDDHRKKLSKELS